MKTLLNSSSPNPGSPGVIITAHLSCDPNFKLFIGLFLKASRLQLLISPNQTTLKQHCKKFSFFYFIHRANFYLLELIYCVFSSTLYSVAFSNCLFGFVALFDPFYFIVLYSAFTWCSIVFYLDFYWLRSCISFYFIFLFNSFVWFLPH